MEDDERIDFSDKSYFAECFKKINDAYRYVSFVVGMFDAYARKNRISLTDMKILHGLRYQNCTRQRDFVETYNLSRTTVNTAVIKMASKSLVVINPKDKTITLTDKGVIEADKIGNFFQELVKKIDKIFPSQAKGKIGSLNTDLNLFAKAITGKRLIKG